VSQEIHVSMGHGADVTPGELVPIVVPIASFGTTVILVGLVLVYRFRTQRLKHDLVKAYLDRGQAAPADLLGEAPSRNGDLRRGLVGLATGIALAIAFFVAGERQATGFGLIPALIGLAYLAVWRIEQGRSGGAEHG
jgi:hypothetical protein